MEKMNKAKFHFFSELVFFFFLIDYIFATSHCKLGLGGAPRVPQVVKNPPAMQETPV